MAEDATSVEDLEEFIPMIDAVLQTLNPKGNSIDSERIIQEIEEIFVYNLEPYKKELMSLIDDRCQLLNIGKKCILSRSGMYRKQKKFIKHLKLEDNIKRKDLNPNDYTFRHTKKRKLPLIYNDTKVRLSIPLQNLLGNATMTKMEIMTKLLEYINENNLLNPKNNDEVLCNSKMKSIFGDRISLASMEKYISNNTRAEPHQNIGIQDISLTFSSGDSDSGLSSDADSDTQESEEESEYDSSSISSAEDEELSSSEVETDINDRSGTENVTEDSGVESDDDYYNNNAQ